MSMGVIICGITAERVLQKNVHTTMTTENPDHIPRLKGKDFRSPRRLAFDIDIILLGPGVPAVTSAYERKLTQLNIYYPHNHIKHCTHNRSNYRIRQTGTHQTEVVHAGPRRNQKHRVSVKTCCETEDYP